MPRTKKCRRVCCRPACRRFRAQSGTRSVNIPLDELEAMRLVDLEHLEQGEASEKMGVSRGTVQRLLRAGREKLISALVSGWHIVIPDGDFGEPAPDCEKHAACGNCRRMARTNETIPQYSNNTQRGEKTMILAATCENEEIFQHFGRTPAFAIFTIKDGLIDAMRIEPTGDSGHGALAGFLKERNVEVLLCGGIGGGALAALAENGIQVVPGVSGGVIEAVGAYLAGTLKTDPGYQCNHHAHEHRGGCHAHDGNCKCHD